jgi:hypothetical protein
LKKAFCVFCGHGSIDVIGLTSGFCNKNPNGKYHALYEGGEKSKYICKYCGTDRRDLIGLTSAFCNKNPNGKYHVPAL